MRLAAINNVESQYDQARSAFNEWADRYFDIYELVLDAEGFVPEQRVVLEPVELAEIHAEIECLIDQVWYNRHQVCREQIEDGTIEIVEKGAFSVNDDCERTIQRDVWERALLAAHKVEEKYGIENLGLGDDFEWGVIYGKLSALRWVVGYEWDMLDT